MSHLIQLRARIQATEVTKKTTNAMRLIAMSTHMRLRQAKQSLAIYKNNIQEILHEIPASKKKGQVLIGSSSRKLLVVIGSQKGLCGNFNANLASYFQNNFEHFIPQHGINYDLIVIGKQMKERLSRQNSKIDKAFDDFSLATINSTTNLLARFILSNEYESTAIFYTRSKTFFLQSPGQIIFQKKDYQNYYDESLSNNLIEEQSALETMNFLNVLSLKAQLEEIVIDSLTAEAASRFLSMDTATRNADDLIATMKLDYNKLRQTIITRELTDLAGVYMMES